MEETNIKRRQTICAAMQELADAGVIRRLRRFDASSKTFVDIEWLRAHAHVAKTAPTVVAESATNDGANLGAKTATSDVRKPQQSDVAENETIVVSENGTLEPSEPVAPDPHPTDEEPQATPKNKGMKEGKKEDASFASLTTLGVVHEQQKTTSAHETYLDQFLNHETVLQEDETWRKGAMDDIYAITTIWNDLTGYYFCDDASHEAIAKNFYTQTTSTQPQELIGYMTDVVRVYAHLFVDKKTKLPIAWRDLTFFLEPERYDRNKRKVDAIRRGEAAASAAKVKPAKALDDPPSSPLCTGCGKVRPVPPNTICFSCTETRRAAY